MVGESILRFSEIFFEAFYQTQMPNTTIESRKSEEKEIKDRKSESDSDDGFEVFAKGPKAAKLPARRSTLRRRKTTTKSASPEVRPITAIDEPEKDDDCYLHVDVVKKLLLEHLMLVYKDLPSLLPAPSKLSSIFKKDPFEELKECLERQAVAGKSPKETDLKREKCLRKEILKRYTSSLSSHSHNRVFGQEMGDQLHQLEHRIV